MPDWERTVPRATRSERETSVRKTWSVETRTTAACVTAQLGEDRSHHGEG